MRIHVVMLSVALVGFVVAFVAFLSEPLAPQIDGSDRDAFEESVEDMLESLDSTTQSRLEDAIVTLTSIRLSDTTTEREPLPPLPQLLNGLTAQETIELAEELARTRSR